VRSKFFNRFTQANASKVLEAFVWGLIGGSGGIAVIAKLFKKWDIPLIANAQGNPTGEQQTVH
jgi:hypothetical protein